MTRSFLLSPRKKAAKKGDYGRVLIVAGSEDYPGAAMLCTDACMAALRSGIDWVTLAAPAKVAWAVNCRAPDIVTVKFPCRAFRIVDAAHVIALAKRHDLVLVGPGLGAHTSVSFIRRVIYSLPQIQKVIDADALRCIDIRRVKNAVLTPHADEWRALCATSRMPTELSRARRFLDGNVILLKGPSDRIVTAKKTVTVAGGSPVMAKAGTGDVLAGLCAGLAAQTHDLFKSACLASRINKKVGSYLERTRGRTFVASDIVGNLYRGMR